MKQISFLSIPINDILNLKPGSLKNSWTIYNDAETIHEKFRSFLDSFSNK